MGTTVDIDGPKGIFTLPETTEKYLIFLAGGIGVTPFLSMIRYATEKKSPQKIHLIYINSSENRTAYAKELRVLAKKNPHFKLTGKIGRANTSFIKEHTDQVGNVLWYIAGPPAMVNAMDKLLKDLGVSTVNIRTESFTGYA